MTFVDQRTVSSGYVVDEHPRLPESWWEAMDSALANLVVTDTDRVLLFQEDIDRSITGGFGACAGTTVSDWAVGHGDLHWGTSRLRGRSCSTGTAGAVCREGWMWPNSGQNRVLGARKRGESTTQADHVYREGTRLLRELV